MATRAPEEDDSRPLLRETDSSQRSSVYGSINNGTEGEQEGSPTEGGDTDQGSTKANKSSGGCWAAIKSRDSFHRRLLVFNILTIILGLVTSGILFLELKRAYGQCIIGMPLYEGGLLTRGVRRFWCRCPLYTIMLTSTIPWVAIMVNWVSDLFTKKCAFGKWLKWQAIVTCFGAGAALCVGIISAWGFGNWCTRVIRSVHVDTEYPYSVTSASNGNKECYSSATIFDKRFPNEFVKLQETFWFTLGIMIMQIALIACWAGSCYYSVSMWARLPKDSFFAQMLLPPGIGPRERSRRRQDGTPLAEAGDIITDQMTTGTAGANSSDSIPSADADNIAIDNHLHEA